MIRELVNRIVFQVVGEDRLNALNDALDDSAQNAEQASRETEDYEAALASLQGRVRRAVNGLQTFGRTVRTNVTRALGAAGRAVGRFGLSVGRMVARIGVAAPVAFAGFVSGAVLLASEAEETRDRMSVALGDIADETEAWANRTSNALGINRNQVRSFVTDFSLQLQRATDLASATDLGQALTERAFDLESFQDVPIDEVFAAFRSGINGSTEPLDRFNVNLRATAVDAFILANGMAASSDAITENTRRLARARLILQETANAQGNLILTQGSFANTFRRFRSTISNIVTDIGTGFLPAATRLFQAITEGLLTNQQRIIDFFGEISDRATQFIENGGLERIVDTFADIAEFAGEAAAAVNRFFNITGRERDIDTREEFLRNDASFQRELERDFPGAPRSVLNGITRARAVDDVDRSRVTNTQRNAARAASVNRLSALIGGATNDNRRTNTNLNQTINVNLGGSNLSAQQVTGAVSRGVAQGNRRSLADISVQSPAPL